MTTGEETKGQTMIYKAPPQKKRTKTEQHEPLLKYGDKIRWYERVNKSVVVSFLKISKISF